MSMERHPMVSVTDQNMVVKMDARENVQQVLIVTRCDVLDFVVNVVVVLASHPRPKLVFKMEHQS